MIPFNFVSFGRCRERTPRSWPSLSRVCIAAVLALGLFLDASAETWRGLTVAPEHRCAPYDKARDYPYPQSVEQEIVRSLGAGEPIVCSAPCSSGTGAASAPASGDHGLARYDDNGNGTITCKEARRHGIAPVPRSHPAYRYMRDGDGDGVVS